MYSLSEDVSGNMYLAYAKLTNKSRVEKKLSQRRQLH